MMKQIDTNKTIVQLKLIIKKMKHTVHENLNMEIQHK